MSGMSGTFGKSSVYTLSMAARLRHSVQLPKKPKPPLCRDSKLERLRKTIIIGFVAGVIATG